MVAKRALWALLPLFILGCSNDSTTVQPPAPLTPDEQTVANVRAIRDALETYASSNSGTYGDFWNNQVAQYGHFANAYTGEYEPSGIRATEPGQISVEYYACHGIALGYRVTGYGKDHMLITLEALDKVPADLRYTHDVTVANAYLVLDAAKRFGEANDGILSTDVAGDQNKDGKTLADMLPGGNLLVNPFEGHNVEPQDGLALANPGSIGYLGADSGTGNIDSFVIEAYACDGDIMMTLLPYGSEYGEIIWTGSYLLRFAIETFAKASGHYPHNLDTETTPGGKTVLDLVTDANYQHVPYFVNYYNQEHYVPVVGTPTGNFTIGYQPIETAGTVTDYVITGRTMFREIIRLGPKPLP